MTTFRTVYTLHRTDTGRLASGPDKSDEDKGVKGGGVHNIPKPLRDMIQPPKGWMFVGADWAAIQFALLMLRAAQLDTPQGYHLDLLAKQQRKELDPHTFLAEAYIKAALAAKLAGQFKGQIYGSVTPELRQLMKGYTYGRAFKGNPDTLSREQGHRPELGRIICEAHDTAFLLGPWQEHEVELVLQRKFTETVGGFRRWFWDSPSRNQKGELVKPKAQEILATVIQGDEADLLKWVMGQMVEDIGPELEKDWLSVLTTTHDSLLIQVKESRVDEGLSWLKGHMQASCPLFGRGFRCSAKVGKNWKEVS